MKKALLVALFSIATVSASAATYKIDSNHANARFSIDHFGTTTNTAGFYGLTGTVNFDPKAHTGAVDIVIPLNTVSSGVEHFNEHLKSADIFNVAKYPTARFKSTKWNFVGDKVKSVNGNLTMHGVTKPVTLEATKFNCYQSPMLKAQVCGGDFETTIDRTQWGIDFLVSTGFAKNVKLNIQIEAAKQ